MLLQRIKPLPFKLIFESNPHGPSPLARYFEGDGDGDGGGGDGDGGGGDGDGGGSSWDGKFTPEQQKAIDGIVNKRFAKEKQEKEKLLGQLKTLQESKSLTAEERDNLQSQIGDLESSLMTAEQKAAKDKAELETKHAKAVKKVEEERDVWQNRYTQSMIDRALTDAAVNSDAHSPEQVRMMFAGATTLVEDKGDDGKSLGTFTPQLKFRGKDPDHEGDDEPKIVELTMPVGEAMAKIKEDKLNENLFKHGGTGGTGKKSSGGQGSVTNPDTMPTLEQFGGDHKRFSEAYRKWRKGHNLDGSRIVEQS